MFSAEPAPRHAATIVFLALVGACGRFGYRGVRDADSDSGSESSIDAPVEPALGASDSSPESDARSDSGFDSGSDSGADSGFDSVSDSGSAPDAASGPRCGDNLVDPPEVCDRLDVGAATCGSRGFAGGQLRCRHDCSDFDTSNCGVPSCGNGTTDPGEACDGTDLNGFSCNTLVAQFAGGTLRCAPDCHSYDVAGCTRGVIVPAASCSDVDVQAAIDAAAPNATVIVPAGTCTWRNTVTVSRPVALVGAGVDGTTIIDAIGSAASATLDLRVSPVRVSGFTFLDLGLGHSVGFEIAGSGSSRVDHVRLQLAASTQGIVVRDSRWCLVDHARLELDGDNEGIQLFGANDASWGAPLTLGTGDATYVEDSTLVSTMALFAAGVHVRGGGRVASRFNEFRSASVYASPFSDFERGALSTEIYENRFEHAGSDWLYLASYLGAGTGHVFGNVTVGNYSSFVLMNEYRTCNAFGGRPSRCDGRPRITGSTHVDGNEALPRGSGAHTGSMSTSTLVDPTQSWASNEWVGRYVHNLRDGSNCRVTSNTATTVVCTLSMSGAWLAGDAFKITNGYPCLDQPGRGPDVAPMDGVQDPRPIHEWNNTLGGSDADLGFHDGWGCANPSVADHFAEGRDYINDTPAPGYRSYVYPHPLARINP